PTPNTAAFLRAVGKHLQGAGALPGERVRLAVLRDGKKLEVSAPVETAYPTPISSRADAWNSRHDAFPGVFVYDGAGLATDCGAPLVAADGKVAAVILARLGSGSHTYAIPAGQVRHLIAELRKKSGP